MEANIIVGETERRASCGGVRTRYVVGYRLLDLCGEDEEQER